MAKFRIEVKNSEVGRCLKENNEHPNFADGWAEPRRIDIDAMNEDCALAIARLRYPPEQGFVITVVPVQIREPWQ